MKKLLRPDVHTEFHENRCFNLVELGSRFLPQKLWNEIRYRGSCDKTLSSLSPVGEVLEVPIKAVYAIHLLLTTEKLAVRKSVQ
jgi:hypothetical protein